MSMSDADCFFFVLSFFGKANGKPSTNGVVYAIVGRARARHSSELELTQLCAPYGFVGAFYNHNTIDR